MAMKFKLLDGKHIDYDAEGVPTIHGPGAIIESNMDLSTMFHNKFERLQDTLSTGQQSNQGRLVQSPGRASSQTELKEIKKSQYKDFLNKMSVDSLKQHAYEEGVDVGDAKDKNAIISKLVNEVFEDGGHSFPTVHSTNPDTGEHQLTKDHSPEVTDEPATAFPSTRESKEIKANPPPKEPKNVPLPTEKPPPVHSTTQHDEPKSKDVKDPKEAQKLQDEAKAKESKDPRDTIKSRDKK